jgi:20S proteasome subunit beta 7
VTGTSVLAVKYEDGVMMAADTLGSYGSLAMFKNVQRLEPFGKSTLIGAGGEISDFQEIKSMLKGMEIDDFCQDDGCE